MCKELIGKSNIKPRIAEEDIRVFKAVHLNKDAKTWRSIYQNYTALLNTLITAEGNEGIYVYVSDYAWIRIGRGFFHSCADINSLKNRFLLDDIVVEAIIPKGSVYYRSKVGNDICSKQIIVTDKIVYKHGDAIKPLLKHPDVLEIVEKDGEKWLNVKDCEHEVYFATKSVGEYSWHEAIDMDVPSTDDFDLIAKYKDEVNDFCEEKGIEVFDTCYWSSGEYYASSAWVYCGYDGVLNYGLKYDTYSVRPVLVHKVES